MENFRMVVVNELKFGAKICIIKFTFLPSFSFEKISIVYNIIPAILYKLDSMNDT